MSEVTIIGIDLAKRAFRLHEARHDGSILRRPSTPTARCMERPLILCRSSVVQVTSYS